MNTFTKTCPLTSTTKTYEVIAEGICVDSFKNARGLTSVNLYRITGENSFEKLCTLVAERDANDLAELKDTLKFHSVPADILTEVNAYLVSKLS